MPGPCKACGAENAPFGYRRRGNVARLPLKMRTTIWVCGGADCTARAIEWKRKADGEIKRPATPPSPPKQANLL